MLVNVSKLRLSQPYFYRFRRSGGGGGETRTGCGIGSWQRHRDTHQLLVHFPTPVVLCEFVKRSYVVLKIWCYSAYKAVGQNIDDDGAYP